MARMQRRLTRRVTDPPPTKPMHLVLQMTDLVVLCVNPVLERGQLVPDGDGEHASVGSELRVDHDRRSLASSS